MISGGGGGAFFGSDVIGEKLFFFCNVHLYVHARSEGLFWCVFD